MVLSKRALLSGILLGLGGCSPARLLSGTINEQGLTRYRALRYGPANGQLLDVWRPNETHILPLVVFFYGGDWRSGTREWYDFVAAPLAQRGFTVVVPDYRKVPAVPYPVFLEDCALAVRWTLENANWLGAEPDTLFLLGHSAGAYNAAMVTLDDTYLSHVGLDKRCLSGCVGISGPYNFLPITRPDVRAVFADVKDLRSTQPITYAKQAGAPMLLLTGARDRVVNPANADALAKAVRASGGLAWSRRYEGLGHVGAITAFAPLFQSRAPILADTVDFFSTYKASSSP